MCVCVWGGGVIGLSITLNRRKGLITVIQRGMLTFQNVQFTVFVILS